MPLTTVIILVCYVDDARFTLPDLLSLAFYFTTATDISKNRFGV